MHLLGDIRFGLRSLVKNPGFTAVAVAMLAIGIGVNAAVFTVTNAVLFKGFPLVKENDRILYISPKGYNCCPSYPDFLDYRAQAKSFEAMAVVHGVGRVVSDQTGFPENISVTEVSADTFKVTGQSPIMGRDFTPTDEIPGAAPVAMLNYGFWERRYAKDPAIVGRMVRINGAPTTIVGVMPEGYSFPQKQDMWVPLVQTERVMNRENRDTWMAFGRLADGVTIENARAEMEIIGKRLEIAYPVTDREHPPVVQKFDEFFIGPNAALVYGSMWGAVGFVLLIACANLANLLLARAMGRSREISVRIALGAGRWRIIRQLLIESVMLSSVGGFLGWWIAKWGVRAYELAMAQKSSWLIIDYTMDSHVLGYLIAVSMGTGILFGLAPALRLSKLDVNTALKDGGRGAIHGRGGGGRGRNLSAVLVTGEMALAVVLLAGAGVMIRSFLKIHNADMGVNTGNVLAGFVDLPAAKYSTPEARIAFFEGLTAGLEATPDVESVALAESPPSTGSPKYPYELAGEPPATFGSRPTLRALKISPGYFRTLEAKLLSGRQFNDADVASAVPVAIVNQMFANKYWPGEDPLGKRLRLFNEKTPGPWLSVVGVVSNIVQNDTTRQRVDPLVYLPYRQEPGGGMWVFARTRVPPGSLTNAFRREVLALDSDLPVFGPFALAERLEMFWDSRFYGGLFLIFAAIALLLASIGLYTVIAHSLSQRTQEIGIRMAIGATARDILKLVFVQGMIPLGIGLAIGLAASLAVNRVLESMLVQVSPSDPITLAVASAALIFSGALGCWIPARRAMRVDPVVALRNE
jgi:putative ABC transport system permease protein